MSFQFPPIRPSAQPACDSPHDLTSWCRKSSVLHTRFFEMSTSATLSLVNGETDEISSSPNPIRQTGLKDPYSLVQENGRKGKEEKPRRELAFWPLHPSKPGVCRIDLGQVNIFPTLWQHCFVYKDVEVWGAASCWKLLAKCLWMWVWTWLRLQRYLRELGFFPFEARLPIAWAQAENSLPSKLTCIAHLPLNHYHMCSWHLDILSSPSSSSGFCCTCLFFLDPGTHDVQESEIQVSLHGRPRQYIYHRISQRAINA